MLEAKDEVFQVLRDAIAEKREELDDERRIWSKENWAFETCFNNRPTEFSRQGVLKTFRLMERAEKCNGLEREIKKIEAAVKEYFIEEIPQRVKMTELLVDDARDTPCEEVAQQFGVKLKRSGRQLSGCCPLHQENTPSFFIDPTKNVWYCMGCHKGGDSIKLVEELRQCNFVDAVKYLTT